MRRWTAWLPNLAVSLALSLIDCLSSLLSLQCSSARSKAGTAVVAPETANQRVILPRHLPLEPPPADQWPPARVPAPALSLRPKLLRASQLDVPVVHARPLLPLKPAMILILLLLLPPLLPPDRLVELSLRLAPKGPLSADPIVTSRSSLWLLLDWKWGGHSFLLLLLHPMMATRDRHLPLSSSSRSQVAQHVNSQSHHTNSSAAPA